MAQIKIIVIIVLAALYFNKADGQDLESVFHIGSLNDRLVFSGDSGNNYEDIYLFNESDQTFELFEKNKIQPMYKEYFVGYFYIEDDFKRYSVPRGKDYFPFAFEIDEKFKIIKIHFNAQGTGYDIKNGKVYLGNHSDNPDLHLSLPIHSLDIKNGQLTKLPLKGINPKIIGDYLYYADYSDPEQFDLVYDIYRVKINNWAHPEKIFKNNYMNGWKVGADGKHLLLEVIESGYKPQKVIYNLEQKKYELIEEKDLPRAVFYAKNKDAFCFYDISLQNGKRRFVYVEIPALFTHTPSWALDFGSSFITTYLLEDAPEDELRKLNKSQLRLLRNAIFARRGWRFQSEDLSAFFNQFPWYKEQMAKIENNEKIMLTNTDKYRSQLILGIEQEK